MDFKRIAACLSAAVLLLSFSGCKDAVTVTTTQAVTTTLVATTTTTTAPTTTATATATTTAANLSVSHLDPAYERLLLVNAEHPLPKDFDNTASLTTVEKKYLNGSLNQIDKDIYPYLLAMLQDAWAQGVKLYVRSPYRSYSTQNYLFNRKVQRVIDAGTPKSQAEAVAAKSVARPGTSEHQTGLAIDFNVASSEFEKLPAFQWMKENAENYGFILRYPKGKTDITGIMYESWHWRFVGINTAKEMNELGVALEEYVALRNDSGV